MAFAASGGDDDVPDYMADISAFVTQEGEERGHVGKAKAVGRRGKPGVLASANILPGGLTWQEKRKLKLQERQEKEKRRREEEESTLRAGLAAPLDASNVGFRMLQKMGFNPGGALGKGETVEGREGSRALKAPVEIDLKRDRLGLGRADLEAVKKREKERREEEERACLVARAEEMRVQYEEARKIKWDKGILARDFRVARTAVLHLERGWEEDEVYGGGNGRGVRANGGAVLNSRLCDASGAELGMTAGDSDASCPATMAADVADDTRSRRPSVVDFILSAARKKVRGSRLLEESTGGHLPARATDYDDDDGEEGETTSPSRGIGAKNRRRRGALVPSRSHPDFEEAEGEDEECVDGVFWRVKVHEERCKCGRCGCSCRGEQEQQRKVKEDGGEEVEEDHCLEITPQILQDLLLWLRSTHNYCIYCGCQYDCASELQSNCPGVDEASH